MLLFLQLSQFFLEFGDVGLNVLCLTSEHRPLSLLVHCLTMQLLSRFLSTSSCVLCNLVKNGRVLLYHLDGLHDVIISLFHVNNLAACLHCLLFPFVYILCCLLDFSRQHPLLALVVLLF